jgi:hypothetical protein
MLKRFILSITGVELLIVLFILLASFAHCSTSSTKRPNSLGIEQTYGNPNIYLFGALACGHAENACTFFKDEKDRVYTNLRFNPYNTPMLYDDAILFCGDVSDYFRTQRGAFVVTYRRQTTLNYKGVGCHDLISVFEVPAPKEQQ